MTITTTTIANALNYMLNVSETGVSIARATRTGLKWLSKQGKWSCLHTKKDDYSLVADDNSMDWPDNFRLVDSIVLNDGTRDSHPLDKTSWEQVRKDRAATSNSGEPTAYVQRGKKFELNRNCDQSYTGKVWYWRWHPGTPILFPDDFEASVNNAVAAAYLDEKGRHQKAQYFYEMAKEALPTDMEDEEPTVAQYQDL